MAQRRGFSPLAARPGGQLLIVQFAIEKRESLPFEANRFALAKRLLLTQSCSLRSVTLTSTCRRSLISSLQGVINALFNGQLVPRILFKTRKTTKKEIRILRISFFGAEKRIRTSGTFQAHTRFPKAQNREKGAKKPDFKQKTARNGGFLFLQRGSNRG